MEPEAAALSFRRFLAAYLAYQFLFDFVLAYAIYAAWFEFAGLSYVEIGALLAIWSGSALLFELGTGALSDALDRRLLLIASPLIKALTFVIWVLAGGDFWLYALGFVLWSFGEALESGTGEALLYERAEAAGRKADYDRIYGQARAARHFGVGAGLLLGGLVAAANMELTFWLSLPPLVLAALAGFWLKDLRRQDKTEDEAAPGFWEAFRLAWRDLGAAPDARFLIAYLAIGLILFEELEEFDQLFYVAVDLPIILFGVAGVAGLVVHGLGSLWAHRLARFGFLAWAAPALAGLLLVAAAAEQNPWFVIVLELAYLVAVPPAVLAEARFQQVIEGRARATATSALYFAQNLMALAIALGFGALAELVGIRPAYAYAGLVLLPIALWVFVAQRRGQRVF